MAITSITITQDNIIGSSNLVAAHSPVCFLADVAWTTAAPDVVNVEVLSESDVLIDTYKAIPYSDATGVRTFAFQASLAIRSMLTALDDFIQTADTWAFCTGFTGRYKIKFVDPGTPATYDEVLIDFAQAVRQVGQSCNLREIFENDADFYLAPKNGVVYVYFYNSDEFLVSVSIIYGYLYNRYVLTDSRNICASGWHVPTKTEYETLITYLGGSLVAGGKLKEIGTTYWETPNIASNSALFNLRPTWLRNPDGTWDEFFPTEAYVWTGTQENALSYYDLYVTNTGEDCSIIGANHTCGLSLRIIKDSTTLTNGQTGTYIGNDGRVYRTICIGTQEWIADNLAETKYRNGDTIPTVSDNSAWSALTTGAKCAYNNDEANALTNNITTVKGSFRFKTTADQVKNITIPTIGGTLTKQVIPLDTCTGDLVLKYLDRNGQYRFYNCNKYYQTKDNPEKIGSINRFLTDLLTGQSDSHCVGYKNERIIEAVASVPSAYLDKFSDIYTSPRVYLKIGTGDGLADWLLVEVQSSDNLVKRRKGNTGLVNLTITLPEHYTISML